MAKNKKVIKEIRSNLQWDCNGPHWEAQLDNAIISISQSNRLSQLRHALKTINSLQIWPYGSQWQLKFNNLYLFWRSVAVLYQSISKVLRNFNINSIGFLHSKLIIHFDWARAKWKTSYDSIGWPGWTSEAN